LGMARGLEDAPYRDTSMRLARGQSPCLLPHCSGLRSFRRVTCPSRVQQLSAPLVSPPCRSPQPQQRRVRKLRTGIRVPPWSAREGPWRRARRGPRRCWRARSNGSPSTMRRTGSACCG
jgi:hypothetical protein